MRTTSYAGTLVALFYAFAGCHSHHHDDHAHGEEHHGHSEHGGHDHGSQAITHFTDDTELFVEFDTLVVGEESAFAAHLTRLDDFRPVDRGRVSVVLSGGGQPDEGFVVEGPSIPGIFRPVAVPEHAGERRLALVLDVGDISDRHELGTVLVHKDHETANKDTCEQPEGGIPFLKEQQWQVDFATAPVLTQSLQASISINGTIRARPDGEARIIVPIPGRLLPVDGQVPHMGMKVRRDQVLLEIVPRLGMDSAALEAALVKSRLEVERTSRERKRLEDLLKVGAVPERRVIEARLAEKAARADGKAAQRQVRQFKGAQQAGGGGTAGRFAVTAPMDGVLAHVNVMPGTFVEEGRELFHVVAPDRLWLEAQVPEALVGRVRDTRGAWFRVDGYERAFTVSPETGGRVVALGSMVDPGTRTVPLVYEFDNPGSRLAVGAFARVRAWTGEVDQGPTVPVSALVEEGGLDVVYVQVTGESFERRTVRVGIRDRDLVRVLDGLKTGERVVTRGAYLVRLAASSSSIPAHGHAH